MNPIALDVLFFFGSACLGAVAGYSGGRLARERLVRNRLREAGELEHATRRLVGLIYAKDQGVCETLCPHEWCAAVRAVRNRL